MSFFNDVWNWSKGVVSDVGDYFGHLGSSAYNYILNTFAPFLGLDYIGDIYHSNSGLDVSSKPEQPVDPVNEPDQDSGLSSAIQYSNPEMQFNAEQAQLNRDFQERMSSTAYSRAIADLKRNGINPYAVLGGLNGASSPSGSVASYSGYESSKLTSRSSALTALAVAMLKLL